MMRTTILVTALLVSMLSASAVYAQRVESVLDNGHPVINCDRMQPSQYTTAAKGSTEAELKTAAANEKVYKRFAVYNKDNNASSDWSTAFTHCTNVSGGGWRLPTQRELMLIWVLKRELEKTGAAPFVAYHYWSATEYSSGTSWGMSFGSGYTNFSYAKSYSYMVRCVRELMP